MIDLVDDGSPNAAAMATFRDEWWHRREEGRSPLGQVGEAFDAGTEMILNDSIPVQLRYVGSVVDARDEEGARVALAGLIGGWCAAWSAQAIGGITHAVYHEVVAVLAVAAIPYMTVLGITPACACLGGVRPEPQTSLVKCPGCGMRLFGEVAARGACLACFPTLPEGGIAEALGVAGDE